MEERQVISVSSQPHFQVMTESAFVKGTPVEVSLPDEHCSGAWFPAVILQEVERNLILVEYQGLTISGMTGCVRDVVDTLRIRPSPPGSSARNKFDVLDIVDAFLDFGWWTGVVTHIDGNQYTVRLQNQMEQMEFNQFELRPHVEWENGTWIQDPVQERKQTGNPVKETNILERTEQSKTTLSKVTKEDPKYSASSEEIVDVVQTDCTLMVAGIPVMERHGNIVEANPLSLWSVESHSLAGIEASPYKQLALHSNMKGTEEIVMERLSIIEDFQPVPISSEEFHSHASIDASPGNQLALQSNMKGTEETVMEGLSVIEDLQLVPISSEESHPLASTEASPDNQVALQSNVEGTGGTVMEGLSVNEDFQLVPVPYEESHPLARTEASPDDQLALQSNMKGTEETVMGVSVVEYLQLVPNSSEESYSLASVDDRVSPENKVASGSNMAIIPCSMQNLLPFAKTYPIWKEVNSMEVFHSMPQHPHFQPLQEMNELLRQGEAVGYMISFANMANKTKRARFDEPKSYLENRLNALPMLEAVGFNVQPIRTRLQELLQHKDNQEQLDKDLKQYNEKLITEKDEGNLLKLELDALYEKLRDLEESLAERKRERQQAEMEKQTKSSNILALQEQCHAIHTKIKSARLEFSCIAAKPLNRM